VQLPPDYVFQLSLAGAWAAGYVGWAYLYYLLLDPMSRGLVGRALNVRIVWTCDARQYFQQGRYKNWHWGIADAPADRVVFIELVVRLLGAGVVMVAAGLWPIALLYLALVHHWAAPLTLYVCLLLAIPIFSIYWAGRYRPPMR
jgi:hypothetical protein